MTTAQPPTVHAVDDAGIHIQSATDQLCNVLFDGRRIWSFWVQRDAREGSPLGSGLLLASWPHRLLMHLEGTTQVTITTGTEVVIFDEEVRFGTEDRRLTVVDRAGQPLGLDNYGRLVVTFETRDSTEFEPLLDAVEAVLGLLAAQGLQAFPAYGTLLGAVREGTLIGHDSDADVAYLSRCTHPFDVTMESLRLQRAIQRQGFETSRHSGAAFKVSVLDPDGTVRGLDVFAGFLHEGHLALLGEVWTPADERWILPLGTTTLNGREFPAPAQAEKVLEAMYGPTWRVPDPAFRFETDRTTHWRFNAWFRGNRVNRAEWDDRFGRARKLNPPAKPHALARHVHEREPEDVWVLEIGSGRGRDARWLAMQGRPTVGLDYSQPAAEFLRARIDRKGWPLEFHTVNLLETRQVLAWGGLLGAREGPRAVMARHFIDSTTSVGLDNFWRLVSMVLHGGGRLHLEFIVEPVVDPEGRPALTRPLEPDAVVREIERRGGAVTAREEFPCEPLDYGYNELAGGGMSVQTCRLEVQWKGRTP